MGLVRSGVDQMMGMDGRYVLINRKCLCVGGVLRKKELRMNASFQDFGRRLVSDREHQRRELMRREGVQCTVMYVSCERRQELGELLVYYNCDYRSSWHFKHWNQGSQLVFQSA